MRSDYRDLEKITEISNPPFAPPFDSALRLRPSTPLRAPLTALPGGRTFCRDSPCGCPRTGTSPVPTRMENKKPSPLIINKKFFLCVLCVPACGRQVVKKISFQLLQIFCNLCYLFIRNQTLLRRHYWLESFDYVRIGI